MDFDWAFAGEIVINGGLSGLMYGLIGLGIVLIYKSSAVPNLAQGALAMLGAYIVLGMFESVGLPIWLAIPVGMVIMFGVGTGVERFALRKMAGQPIVMVLMLTLGLDIFFHAFTLTVWGGTNRSMSLGIPDDAFIVADMFLDYSYLVGGIVSVILVAFVAFFFKTRRGIVLRAVSDDPVAAWSVGISVENSIGLSWAMSAVIAGVAGVLFGNIQGVDYTLGLLFLKGVAVAVLGGLDSVLGAVLAGVLLGVAEGLASGYLDPLVGGGSKDLVIAGAIILTIIVRPHGLFGREDIERV